MNNKHSAQHKSDCELVKEIAKLIPANSVTIDHENSALINQDGSVAVLTAAIMLENNVEMTDKNIDELTGVARRIANAMCHEDEPRFSLYDYLDAVINQPPDIEIAYNEALANPDNKAFFDVILDMAERKRMTYGG